MENKLININFILNNQEKSLPFSIQEKLKIFNKLVSITYGINMNKFEIYINKKKIKNYELTMNQLLEEGSKKRLIYKKIISNSNDCSRSKLSSNINDRNSSIIVKIEGFPSKSEIIDIIDKFKAEYNLSESIEIKVGFFSIDIFFKELVINFLIRILVTNL
jgi:hypothetical protein